MLFSDIANPLEMAVGGSSPFRPRKGFTQGRWSVLRGCRLPSHKASDLGSNVKVEIPLTIQHQNYNFHFHIFLQITYVSPDSLWEGTPNGEDHWGLPKRMSTTKFSYD